VILFNIIAPVGWKVGIVRIEDVAIGFAVSLGVGLVFWPRGAAALVRDNLAEAYSRTADFVAVMVAQVAGLDGGADPAQAGQAAELAVIRLDDSFSQFLAERSASPVDPDRAARLVGGAARMLRTGHSMASLRDLESRPAAGSSHTPRDPKPCAGQLEEEAQSIRAWFVTLGDSLVHGTSVPPPQSRDPAARSGLLDCTRQQISGGGPAQARDALAVLWANEHLEMLWQLEQHLSPTAQDQPEPQPASAAAA
jgi:uncharacterized membrane protein YccC